MNKIRLFSIFKLVSFFIYDIASESDIQTKSTSNLSYRNNKE